MKKGCVKGFFTQQDFKYLSSVYVHKNKHKNWFKKD